MSPLNPVKHGKRAQRRATLAICGLLTMLAALPAGAAQAAAPPNDDFADAQLVNVGDRVTGTTVDATLQAGEPPPGSSYSHSVWYRLRPSASETLRIDNCAGDRWAELAIFTGTGLGDLTEAPLTRGGCSSGSRVYLAAVAATTYYVRVTGYDPGPGYTDGAGPLVLSVARPQAPANDDFEHAQPIGRPAHITSSNVDATVQAGEPAPAVYGGSGHSVWYRLDATSHDGVVVTTCDGTNSPMVAVYTGTSVGALTEVGREGGACGIRTTMSFITQPGTTYYIAVRSFGDGAQDFTLNLSAPSSPPPPGDTTPPPDPTCPIQFAAGLPTYQGTHSGGGIVCLSVTQDFTGVAWFHASDVAGERCTVPWHVVPMIPPTPIVDRRFGFANSYSQITGAFPTNQGARGTLRVTQQLVGRPLCNSVLTWTATTTATPPWADVTPPSLRLGGATVQHPLRRARALLVRARCPGEACAVSASATVAGVKLTAATRTVAPSRAGRTVRLALPGRARRALAAALRSRRSVRVRVTVLAGDAAGNRAKARRMVTLRR